MKNILFFTICQITFLVAYSADTIYIHITRPYEKFENLYIFKSQVEMTDVKKNIYGICELMGFVFKTNKKPIDKKIWSGLTAESPFFKFSLKTTLVYYDDIYEEHIKNKFAQYKFLSGYDTTNLRKQLWSQVNERPIDLLVEWMNFQEWTKKTEWFDSFYESFFFSQNELNDLLKRNKTIDLQKILNLSEFKNIETQLKNKVIFIVDENIKNKEGLIVVRRFYLQ